MTKRIANRIAALALLALLLALVPTSARAVDINVDTSKSCTLTIRSATSLGGVPGVSYALYRVASVSGSRPDVAVLPAFATYPVNWSVSTVSKWNDLALTLKGYVQADGVTPDLSGKSDASGNLTFDNVPTGLYLVVGKTTQNDEETYTPSPCFVVLPARNNATVPISWTYTETIQPKFTVSYNGSGGGEPSGPSGSGGDKAKTEERRVIKVWEDDDPKQRPDKITVSLYCDGKLYSTAELTEAKSWRAVFSGLPKGCDWTLVEDTPENYTVSLSQEGTTFLVTNTAKGTGGQGDSGIITPNPDDDGDGDSDSDGDTIIDTIEVTEVYPGAKLPRLGLLWWPVPLLLGGGLLCVLLCLLIGRSKRRGRRERLFAVLGIVCAVAAVGLTVYNLATQDRAGEAAEQNLSTLRVTMPLEATGVTVEPDAAQLPDYLLNPDMPMPTVEIDGVAYIGVLSLPSLGIELPVAAELSDATLYKAPCRYYGSAYLDNFIIAAHNYRRHFGPIHRLRAGDALTFTDVDGNTFRYTVAEQEVLQADDVERMISTDYALTLFTCTLGGQQRITIRCTADK